MNGHGIGLVVSAEAGLASAGVGWLMTIAMTAAESPGLNGDTALATFASAALTAVSGAFLWLVKLVATGQLQHRDPAEAHTRLTVALEKNSEVIERAVEREEILTRLLIEARDGGDR